MKIHLLSVLMLTSLSVGAMTDQELENEMRSDLKKHLVTLKAPKIIFHWVDASDITPQGQYNNKHSTNAAGFTAYVEKQGKKIFNKRSANDPDIAGPGLYMASDATISRSYGGDKSFGLIVGLINKGARLISDNYNVPFNAKIDTEVKKRGCIETDYTGILDTKDAACTKIKQILVKQDISFAEGRLYSWGMSSVPGCTSRDVRRDINFASGTTTFQDTFVNYNTKMFDEIIGVTHKTGAGNTNLAKQLMSYLKGQNLLSKEQQADNSIKAMSTTQIKTFSKKYILGCKP